MTRHFRPRHIPPDPAVLPMLRSHWCTVKHAAKTAGVAKNTIHLNLRAGKLDGKKQGNLWLIRCQTPPGAVVPGLDLWQRAPQGLPSKKQS